MPANFNPVFPLTPVLTIGKLTAANTATDGTGTTLESTAAGAFGRRVDKDIARALGTNVQTVARIFANNGSDKTVAANNALITELVLPATTADNAAEIGPHMEREINITIPSGWKVLVCIGTAVGGGWMFSVVAGDN